MENLNAEQIKKALECCSHPNMCRECPCSGKGMCWDMKQDALTLITSQEQRIKELENRLKECENGYEGTLHLERAKLHDAEEKVKELTEENYAWQKQLISAEEQLDKAYYELACEVEDLRAENERLHASCTELTQCCTKLETLYKIESKRVDTTKADTVRQMQKLIKERCIKGGIYPVLVARTIEQVAKEILEGNNEN